MKIKIVFDTRKVQKLKYYKVSLPEVTGRKHRFHIECYRRFIALPKSHRENYKDELTKLHQPLKEKSTVMSSRSSSSPKNVQVSSTGV